MSSLVQAETATDKENVMLRSIPAGYTSRPARMDDAEQLVTLFNRCSMELVGEAVHDVEDLRSEWTTPEFDLERDTRVVVDETGAPVAYAEVWDLEEPHVQVGTWGRVDPAHRGRGIGAALLAWEEERARMAIARAPSDARVVQHQGALVSDRGARELFEKHGFEAVRSFRRMRIEMDVRPDEPVWPDGVTVRSFVPGEDLEGALRCVRASFQDHWGHVDSPFEEELKFWEHWTTKDPGFDPAHWHLATTGDGEVVGVCLGTLKRAEDPSLGWIHVLGVVREWRHKGVALGLLRHAFRALHDAGKRKVGLGVDATSLTGANRLYEKAGMFVQRESISYEKELRPGRDLSRRTLDEESGDE
jgi:mycothiol synthase